MCMLPRPLLWCGKCQQRTHMFKGAAGLVLLVIVGIVCNRPECGGKALLISIQPFWPNNKGYLAVHHVCDKVNVQWFSTYFEHFEPGFRIFFRHTTTHPDKHQTMEAQGCQGAPSPCTDKVCGCADQMSRVKRYVCQFWDNEPGINYANTYAHTHTHSSAHVG